MHVMNNHTADGRKRHQCSIAHMHSDKVLISSQVEQHEGNTIANFFDLNGLSVVFGICPQTFETKHMVKIAHDFVDFFKA